MELELNKEPELNKAADGDPSHVTEERKQSYSWITVISGFSSDTTFHGWKYLFQSPGRYGIRRILWALIMLGFMGLFLLLVAQKIIQLLSHPKTVNLDVVYNSTMLFPAVTICNQNDLSLTSVHGMGLYDLLVNDNNKTLKTSEEEDCDRYIWHEDVCQIPNTFAVVQLNGVTRKVCRQFCSHNNDLTCSGFMFHRLSGNCTLSSYTGEWIDSSSGKHSCSGEHEFEFYRRIRCPATANFFCDFELGSICPLQNMPKLPDGMERWEFRDARDTVMLRDNTLNDGYAQVATMVTSSLRKGMRARLLTPYFNTTGRCIELFYWIQNGVDAGNYPIIQVLLVSEENTETFVKTTGKRILSGWSQLFAQLSPGLNRIVIEGLRRGAGYTALAIDDIIVQTCSFFDGETNCMKNAIGNGYFGHASTAAQPASPCLSWSSVKSPHLQYLPDDSVLSAGSNCRNMPGDLAWSKPSCIVNGFTPPDTTHIAECDVKHCRYMSQS
jgi:hypothetical protein